MIKIERKNFANIDDEQKRAFKRLSAADQELKGRDKKPSEGFNNRKWGAVKKSIAAAQHDKCCYCERDLGPESDEEEAGVEHYRPKNAVEKSPGHSGYWWLAYDIENLLFSCEKCNNAKGAKFPIEEESNRADDKNRDIDSEQPMLINPLEEDPSLFFEYDLSDNNELFLKVTSNHARGRETIDILDLNSRKKLESRKTDFERFKDIIRQYRQSEIDESKLDSSLEDYIGDHAEFAGLYRFALKQEGIQLPSMRGNENH